MNKWPIDNAEIAVITGLAALNPAIFNQTFSTFATADQIYHLQGLGVEANLGSLNAIEIEQIRNEILSGEGNGVTGPHTIAAINNVQAAQGAGLAQAAQPTSTSAQPSENTTTMSTDMVSSGIHQRDPNYALSLKCLLYLQDLLAQNPYYPSYQ